MNLEYLVLIAFVLILVSTFLLYWSASARQRRLAQQATALLKQQDQANQCLKQMLSELRKHTRLLNELLDEAANSPDYDFEEEFLPEQELDLKLDLEQPESAIPQGPVSRKVYVGNLHYEATEDELRALFQPYGDIEVVNIPLNRHNRKPRGFGFVTFAKASDAEQAARGMQGMLFKNRSLQVNFAKDRDHSAF